MSRIREPVIEITEVLPSFSQRLGVLARTLRQPLEWWLDYRRKHALIHRMGAIDFAPLPAADLPQLRQSWLFRLPLMQSGENCLVRNIFRGQFRNVELVVLDYHHWLDQPIWQTVAGIRLNQARLSSFVLWPRAELKPVLGENRIEISANQSPMFRQNYRIFASRQEGINEIFRPRLQRFLGRHPGWCIQGSADWLLFYQPRYRPKPRRMTEFLWNVYHLYRPFHLR
jgi:hypothetical protein